MNGRYRRLLKRETWAICLCLAGLWLGGSFRELMAGGFPELQPHYANPQRLRDDASLQAVAFVNESVGLAVGDRGTVLLTQDAGETWQIKDSGVECRLDDVLWINPRRAVAVGGAYDRVTGISRSVVLTSQDGGVTWRRADDQELPRLRTVALRKDRRTMVATGDWSASSLSREFESHDFGLTWKNGGELDGQSTLVAEPSASELLQWTTATKVNTPIRDACRIGQSGLCAVGDHGVITQSDDSGKTWQTKRGDARHCAVVIFAVSPTSMPWPIVGSESLEMRNRVGVLLCQHRSDREPPLPADPTAANTLDLSRQAAVMLGASGVDSLIAEGSSITAQTAIESWLSIHRPSVVVVDDSIDDATRKRLTTSAMSMGVQRIVSYSFGSGGDSMLHSNALLPSTGILHRDLWQDALLLVAPARKMPRSISIRRLYDVSGNGKRGASLSVGLRIDEGQKLSSPVKIASRRQLQIVQARLAQPEQIAKLIRSCRTGDEFATGINAILDQTGKEDQFRLAWSVLQDYGSTRASSLDLQVKMLQVIAERFESFSAGKWASLRRQSIDNGSEWRRLRSSLSSALPNAFASPSRSNDLHVAQASEIVAVSPFQSGNDRVVQAAAIAPLIVPKPRVYSQKTVGQSKSDVDLVWEFHPLVLLARDAAMNRGDENGLHATPKNGSGNLRRLLADPRASSWAKLTRSGADQRSGGSLIVAQRTHSPPKLDGILDDPFWQGHALGFAGEIRPPQVAYDDDYIYIALQFAANKMQSDDFDRQQSTTIRDHDLESIDRVELAIDIDRDLLTAMKFSVSDAGRTHDAIDGQSQFDPTWYIAVKRDDTLVNFELAIDWRDVTELPIVPGQSWLMSAKCRKAGSQQNAVMPNPSDWIRVEFR